jgi:competence protein ComEC
MSLWNQIPFLRLLLPFLAGILVAVYTELEFEHLAYILIGVFIFIALFVFIKVFNLPYKNAWLFGCFTSLIFFLCGIQIIILNTDRFSLNHFSKFKNPDFFYVKTNSTWLEKENSYKAPVTIIAVKQKGKWIQTSGKALCYFKKDSLSTKIKYGDCLIVKAKFTEVTPPKNPSEFNYKRFLSFHNIYHQAYISSKEWASTGVNRGNTIISTSISIREKLLNIYKKNNIKGDEYAVGSALILGYTEKLDQDLISAYASSGVLHVLSVSGLHVGIIYLIANYLLFFLDKLKYGKFYKMVLLLITLWFYALLTGLSPSVLRSAAMFSIVVIAKTRKYNTNIFNTLAVSCFLLLLYNPHLITDVGFQLSYLAVLGIVAIQPWLYEKWQPKTWLMDQVWGITLVAVAAQLFTFPLGLLYFHQFSNYFLFSNLIAIPVSTLILGYGLLLFILGQFSSIGITCGKIFSGLVWFLNKSVQITDQIPGSLTQGVSITVLETLILYALIVFLLVFFYKKQIAYLFASLTIIILLLSIQISEAHFQKTQKAIIVYDVAKASAYDFISKNQTLFLADSTIIQNKSQMQFHINQNWRERNIIKQETCKTENLTTFYNNNVSIKNNYIQFYNKRIVMINSLIKINPYTLQKLNIDLVILSKNPKVNIEDIQRQYNFKRIIFDSSNAGSAIKKWKKQCISLCIDFYSIPDSGAYIEEI